jgi:uncharacterized protein (DUF1697 family)
VTVWVALLRGVNVGGGNRLPMADLRSSVESLGYDGVATYIQSGNVVFRSGHDEPGIVDALRTVLAERHGLSVPVVVRAAGELAGAAGRHPFDDGSIEPKHLHVAFLDRRPDLAAGPDPDDWLPDVWAVDGRELFLAFPNGSARSTMTIQRFERLWGVTATARNLNTVARLVEMTGPLGHGPSD